MHPKWSENPEFHIIKEEDSKMVEIEEEKFSSEEQETPLSSLEISTPDISTPEPRGDEYQILEKLLKSSILKLEPQNGQNIRKDIFKTKIFRLLQKIPLNCVYKLKLVKIVDYKSVEKETYKETFMKIFEFLNSALEKEQMFKEPST